MSSGVSDLEEGCCLIIVGRVGARALRAYTGQSRFLGKMRSSIKPCIQRAWHCIRPTLRQRR